MDAWSIAQLGLDLLFAVLAALVVAGFIYRRESKLRHELVEVLGDTAFGLVEAETDIAKSSATPTAADRASRYLEAVRMYRGGRHRDEIENELGISLSELELLSKVQ